MNVLVIGVNGLMGQTLVKDLEALNLNYQGINPKTIQSIKDFDGGEAFDVIIDFSHPSIYPILLDYAIKHNKPLVIGTTGLNETIEKAILKASQSIPIFKSANLSYGVNILNQILKDYMKALEVGYDIEIIEQHHNQKIDAPSGTALLLKEGMEKASNKPYKTVCDRSKTQEKRTQNEIGIHAIRGGNIVGDHTVMFAGENDQLMFTHKAQSKHLFTKGAIKAAQYIIQKKPGLYSMETLIKESRG